MNRRVKLLNADNIDDFFKVHSGECGWCYCTAWWVPTWEGWTKRSDDENRQFRLDLFTKGEFDGYILYVENKPAGWCQVGQRDRLTKLIKQYKLEPNPEVWAITCFVIKPEYRNNGLAVYMLKVILEDLKARGVKLVQAFPKRTDSNKPGEHWKGPERMYVSIGFTVERDDRNNPILSMLF